MRGVRLQRQRERAVAFVVARLNSSRLPHKHFRPIGGKPLLAWIIEGLRQCREVDDIVLATVAEPVNLPLRDFAHKENAACFWYEGEAEEVTTRLRRAAEHFEADLCVLVSGDCPLISPVAVDGLIAGLRRQPDGEVALAPPDRRGRPPALEGVSVARRRAWQRADDLADLPELKEHQFPLIRLRPELFAAVAVTLPADHYGPAQRLSVDTPADLEFMNRVWQELTVKGRPFALPEVLRLLQERPELRLINAHVRQRELKETVHPVLFLVDGGPACGYGHLTRCRELGLQIVERLGWPVTFVVDDRRAASLLEEQGLPVAWGAWERPARRPPAGLAAANLAPLTARHHLVVVDIRPRGVAPGWRRRLAPGGPVLVLDQLLDWTAEADLICIPGITGPNGREVGRVKTPPVLAGMEYAIIRREIQRAAAAHAEKRLDVLAYLHDPGQRQAVRAWAARRGRRALLVAGFDPEFASHLAQARILLSGFGASFYEALALRTHPVAWPYSPLHREEARRFYERLGLPLRLLAEEGQLDDLLPLLEEPFPVRAAPADGTPNLVKALAALLKAPGGSAS